MDNKPKRKIDLKAVRKLIDVLNEDRFRANYEGEGDCYLLAKDEIKDVRTLANILWQVLGGLALRRALRLIRRGQGSRRAYREHFIKGET